MDLPPSARRHRPPAIIGLLCLLACLALSACGPRNFNNVNDELRAERLELQRRVAELEAQLEQRLGQIEAMRVRLESAGSPLPDAEPPIFSAVRLDRYTGPIDTDGDARDDLLRLYVRTLDQRGRMLPVAARATVQAVVLQEGRDPTLYREHTWAPAEFDAAYRSGFTGTHYTLELPLDEQAPAELTVRVTVTDATGASHAAQQTFRIARSAGQQRDS